MAGAASSKSLPGLERHEGSDAEPRDIPPLLLMAHTTVESTFAQARLALMATAVESAVPRPTARVSTTTTQTTKTAVRLLPICLQSPSHIRPASSAHACLRSGTCITLINYDLNGFTRPSGISQHTEQAHVEVSSWFFSKHTFSGAGPLGSTAVCGGKCCNGTCSYDEATGEYFCCATSWRKRSALSAPTYKQYPSPL
jgi:hypothetical protein